MIDRYPPEDMAGEDLELWVQTICQKGWWSALDRLGQDCLISEPLLNQLLRAVERDKPLERLLGDRTDAEGLPGDGLSSVHRHKLGPLIHQATSVLQCDGFRLHYALRRIVGEFDLDSDQLTLYLDRAQLFQDSRERLQVGVHAWLEEDHRKAFVMLMPQLECGIRGVLYRLGEPIPSIPAFNPADILRRERVAQVLGRDLRLHLLAIYCDPRGWNLRSRQVDGAADADEVNQPVTNWLLHALLVLGGVSTPQAMINDSILDE